MGMMGSGSLLIVGAWLLAGLLGVGLTAVIGVYVYRDAARRGMEPLGWALAAVFLPNLLGLIVYLIVRSSGGQGRCPACGQPVRSDFNCCPACGQWLGRDCSTCGQALRPGWRACPGCGAPVEAGRAPGSGGVSQGLLWVLAAVLGIMVVGVGALVILAFARLGMA